MTVFSLAFRAIITSQFGIQSHHRSQFWRSEPSLFSVWRSDPPSTFPVLAFGAIITHPFRRLEPSPFPVSTVKSIVILCFDVQSHHRSSVSMFIYFQFRCSEPPLLSSLAFRATFALRRLKSLVILGLMPGVVLSYPHPQPSPFFLQFWHLESLFVPIHAF